MIMESSQDLFPMYGEKNGDSRSAFYNGRNGSTISRSPHDSLGKFKGLESQFAWFSADSPTTTLSIGSDLPGEGRPSEEQVQKTILRLKTWSTASDSVMQNAAIDEVMGSGLEELDDQNSKGVKRKRPIRGQRGEALEGASGEGSGGNGEDSEGIVLCWGSAGKRDNGVEKLTPSGCASEFGISRDAECNSAMDQGSREGRDNMTGSSGDSALGFRGAGLGLKAAGEDQGTLLQLGQTLGVNQLLTEGRTREARSNMSAVGEGMHLGLAPAGNLNEMHTYETTLDGVPVIDEGSSSARMSKTGGGFMPALLMGSAINLPSPREQIIQQQNPAGRGHLMTFPELRNYRESAEQGVEQDLSVSFRASSSGGTTSTSGTSGISDRANKVCKFRGCSKGARGASGLCIAHGGGQRCEKNGCNKGAEGRTVYCKAHGGGRRCQNLGCTKSAEGKTDYCIGHGGGRRCSHEGCDKAARGRSGLCIRHGGGKRCLTEGCTKSAEGYSGLCISHGGGRRCHYEGCSKGAQGSTMFCKAHGGGKRCMIQGCNKGAEGSTPLCKGHGGGKRCMFDGGGICTKSVHGGTLYCVAHGGGKRCQVQGCSKSARGRTDFCVRHGGGKRCKVEGCGKSAQGSTDFCKAHGGGKRCQWGVEGSGFGEPGKGEVCDKFARGKTGLCAAHSAQVQDRRVHGATGLGPGLTPGLFRGLVSGSGQSRLGVGSPSSGTQGMFGGVSYGSPGSSGNNSMKDDGNTIGGGLPGQFLSSSMSSRSGPGMSGNASHSNVSLDGFSVDGLSGSTVHGKPTNPVVPAFPSNFSIGQPLIPPQVLVPLSMQTKDTANKLNNGKPPRPPTSGDGGLSMASRPGGNSRGRGGGVSGEDRVHGGGLMTLLSRDGCNFTGGLGGISLGIATSSPAMKSRSPNAVGGQVDTNSPRVEEGTQKQKQLGSLGTDDVGQFLAARS